MWMTARVQWSIYLRKWTYRESWSITRAVEYKFREQYIYLIFPFLSPVRKRSSPSQNITISDFDAAFYFSNFHNARSFFFHFKLLLSWNIRTVEKKKRNYILLPLLLFLIERVVVSATCLILRSFPPILLYEHTDGGITNVSPGSKSLAK